LERRPLDARGGCLTAHQPAYRDPTRCDRRQPGV